MDANRKATVITDGVRYRARRRYREGRYANPYSVGSGNMGGLFLTDPIRRGMWDIYHLEMEELLRSPNCCPHCGQPCGGDFDW